MLRFSCVLLRRQRLRSLLIKMMLASIREADVKLARRGKAVGFFEVTRLGSWQIQVQRTVDQLVASACLNNQTLQVKLFQIMRYAQTYEASPYAASGCLCFRAWPTAWRKAFR